jgi:hypothetical protein
MGRAFRSRAQDWLNSIRWRRSASSRATLRKGSIPLASAPSTATLLVTTDVMIPKPIVKTPTIQAMFGPRIIDQLRFTL